MFQSAGARSGSKKFRRPGTVECSGNPRKIQSLPECNRGTEGFPKISRESALCGDVHFSQLLGAT